MSEQKNTKSKGGIILAVCIVVIVVLLGVVVYLLTSKKEEEEPVKRNIVVNEKNVEEVIEQLAEERTPPGSYQVTMNTTWNFPSGDEPSVDAYVKNAEANTNAVYFDITRSDTEETIYESPIIPVGSWLEDITLDSSLPDGTFPCLITYHLLDEEDKSISTVKLNYTIDPMKLITNADSAKYDKDKYKFDTTVAGDTVFFYNGLIEDSTDNKKKLTYSGQSNKLEVENRSSVNVKLTVSLKASGTEGIALTSDNTFKDSTGSADSTEPSLCLEIKGADYTKAESTGTHTPGTATPDEAVNSNGVASFETLLKPMEPETTGDAFITQWNPIRNVYEFVENEAIDKTVYGFEFYVTGKCNPNANVNWLDALKECETPELEVVWSIADPTGAQIKLDQANKKITLEGMTPEQYFKSLTITDETGTYEMDGTYDYDNWSSEKLEGDIVLNYRDAWTDWMKDKLVTITLNLTDGSSRTLTVIGD